MQPNNIKQEFCQHFGYPEKDLNPNNIFSAKVSEIIEFAELTHKHQVPLPGIKCPKCENPHPHVHKGDQQASCDDCGAEWEVGKSTKVE